MINVLLLISESWNDIKYPNNNLSNWFDDCKDINIWTISGGNYSQINKCCKHYFQITDKEMFRSLLPFVRAGKIVQNTATNISNVEKSTNMVNRFRKPFFRFIRAFIWRYGKYNVKKLKCFIDEFKPDIIFSVRLGGVKMCRMEKVVKTISNAPLVAFTGDNEFGDGIKYRSFFERINYKWSQKWLDRMIPTYYLYYSMSQDQMDLYKSKYNVKTKFLVKCGDFSSSQYHTNVNPIIKIIYAGKLYANRWKTLGLIAKELSNINGSEFRIQLDIFTSDLLNNEQMFVLNIDGTSKVYDAISSLELKQKYDEYDIALHVESLDEEESQYTKYSFSTKLVDCFSSGCAVMAVCNKNQAGLKYIKEHDIGFTASNENELHNLLSSILNNRSIIVDYSKKVVEFGKKNLQKEIVQRDLLSDFKLICRK